MNAVRCTSKDHMSHKLMVVAHPNDESMFAGLRLATQPNQWKVVCVTNGNNWVRRKEFENAMKLCDAEYEIWSYPDNQHESINDCSLENDLRRVVYEKYWERILTHNNSGEEGHLHHKQINRIMKSIVNNVGMFTFGSQMSDSLWVKKLVLIKQYTSQSQDCMNRILMARCELPD